MGGQVVAAVVGAERARRRDRDEEPLGVGGVLDDRVQAHAAGAGLPLRAGVVLPQPGELGPGRRRRRSDLNSAASSTPA